MAAAIDPADVAERFAHEIADKVSLTWAGDRLVELPYTRDRDALVDRGYLVRCDRSTFDGSLPENAPPPCGAAPP